MCLPVSPNPHKMTTKRKYRNYTNEDIIFHAGQVKSMAGLLRALGLKGGGNHLNMRRKLQQLKVDTSHWTGQLWSKGEQLKDYSNYTRSRSLKKHLIKDKGNVCECCKLDTWLGSPITIELDHIDGDRTNNNLSNLRLLCPNCHSFTPTWKNRKRKEIEGC